METAGNIVHLPDSSSAAISMPTQVEVSVRINTRLTISTLIALSLLVRIETRAQGGEDSFQFGTMLRQTRGPVSWTEKKQQGSADEKRRQQVQRNIARHRELVSRLRGGANGNAPLFSPLNSRRMQAGTGSISGAIFKGDGVTPEMNGTVWAYDEFGEYCGFGRPTSTSAGAYQIPDLRAGKYYVQLTGNLAEFTDQYYDAVTDWRKATLVNVVDAVETRGIDFVLPEYHGALAGKICAADGTPLSDCGVSVYDPGAGTMVDGLADSSGSFVVKGLPSGDFMVVASSFGSGDYVRQWYGSATIYGQGSTLHVVDPGTTDSVNFFLTKGGAIAGSVVAQGGDSAAPGACLVVAVDADGYEVTSGQNDSAGRFVISHLAAGFYTLSVAYYGGGNYTGGWFDRAADPLHATPVQVSVSETVNVTIALTRTGAIAGTISYSVPAGIDVTAYDEQGSYAGHGTSDQNGRYVIAGLPAGRYRALASTLQSFSYSGTHAIDQWYGGGVDFSHAKVVDVHGAETAGGIGFTLLPGASISGIVYSPAGVPIDGGSTIIVYDERGVQIRSVSMWDGFYRIEGLPTGQYRLHAIYTGKESYASEWFFGQHSFQTANVISITAPTVLANTFFLLRTAAKFSGYVTDYSGARLSGNDPQIELMLYEGDRGNFVERQTVSSLGGFEGALFPGKYKAGFFAISWNTRPEQDSLAVAYYNGGRSFSDTSAKFLDLAPGSAVNLDDARMERTGGGITGTVFDGGSGRPVSSGTYMLIAFDEQGRPVAASGYGSPSGEVSGEYRIEGLWQGKFRILAVAGPPGFPSAHTQWYENIDVAPDSVTNVPLPAVPSGAVAVTVGPGTTSGVDFHMSLTTAIRSSTSPLLPQAYALEQNYPNPFNPSTTIRYQIPVAGHVTIRIFDLLGRNVATVENGERQAGTHTVNFNASEIASGVYFYRIQAGSFLQTNRFLVLR